MEIGFNTIVVCFSTFMLGLVAGSAGVFLSLRKRALLSDALAHGALPGLCVAYLIGFHFLGSGRSFYLLLFGAAVSSFLSTVCVQSIVTYTRLKEDAALACTLSVFFGVGVLLLGIIQNLGSGEEGGLNHFIYGQTAAMGTFDAILLFSSTLIILSLIMYYLSELKILCFSSEFADSIGIHIRKLDLLLMILSSFVIVIGLQAVGMLLIVALLVIPPAAARFLSFNLSTLLISSACIGGFSGLIGSIVSSLYPHMPTGGLIVLVAGSIFLISLVLGPNKGWLTQIKNRTLRE